MGFGGVFWVKGEKVKSLVLSTNCGVLYKEVRGLRLFVSWWHFSKNQPKLLKIKNDRFLRLRWFLIIPQLYDLHWHFLFSGVLFKISTTFINIKVPLFKIIILSFERRLLSIRRHFRSRLLFTFQDFVKVYFLIVINPLFSLSITHPLTKNLLVTLKNLKAPLPTHPINTPAYTPPHYFTL